MGRTRHPHQWLKAVYRPGAPLITQIDDGAVLPEAPTSNDAFISSLSCARVVVTMLRHLDPQPGETTLEIGTGTGYTTALLCHRLGDQAVTSIEVDTGLATTAAHRLGVLGVRPHLVTGDGTVPGQPLKSATGGGLAHPDRRPAVEGAEASVRTRLTNLRVRARHRTST